MPVKKQVAVKEKSNKLSVSNLVKKDPANPQPFDSDTTFSYLNTTAYLPLLPPTDNYAQRLLEARLLSVTHNACIITKRNYCACEGFEDFNGKPLPEPMVEWLSSMNLKNEPLVEINKKIFEDFFTWGNVPIEIVRFTVAGKRRLFVYVHNLLEWRLCKPNDDDIVTEAIQSKLFTRKAIITAEQVKKSKRLPIYNPMNSEKDNWVKDGKGVERTLIWYKNSASGFIYYGIPSAVAAEDYARLEYKSARNNLDNFENAMVPSGVLIIGGSLGQEESEKLGKAIINTYTGDGKRGRTVVFSSEQGVGDGSKYIPLDTKTDGSYIEATEQWTQRIILANEWDSILTGLISPSTLGKGAGFITKILEYKQNTVIRPAQRDLMDKVWRHILRIAADWLGFKIDDLDINFSNSIDISGLTDMDASPAVQINEVREAKGLPFDPEMEGKYMKATAKADPKNTGGDDVPA